MQQRNPSEPFGGTSGGTDRHSVPEVARLLGISERAVRKRIDTGKMRAERDGRNWVVILDKPPIGTDGGTSAVPVSEPMSTTIIDADRQIQADVVLQRILAPFIEELGTVREELGATRNELEHERDRREEAERERDDLRRRLDAPQAPERPGDDESRMTSGTTSHSAPQRERTASQPRPWWRRLLDLG